MSAARALRDALDEVIARGDAPGLAAAVSIEGGPRFRHLAGRLYADEAGAASAVALVDEATVWDLASLTKVLSTTAIAARALADGALTLQEAPWPSWPGVTPAHVLAHDAGLPAWLPLYQAAEQARVAGRRAGARVVVEEALRAPLQAAPGARTLYSDLGMIALGALLEERLGAPLDALFAETARALYGPTSLRYVRIDDVGYHPAVPRVAPTGASTWRGRTVVGQVNDDNCFAMGGVSGHAGLFGTIDDVDRAGCALLRAITAGGDPVRDALRRFAARAGDRALGFDRATPGGATGEALSAAAVGHLGFTGTSLFLDPVRRASFTLLTSYVHQGVDRARIRGVRRAFHRAAAVWVDAARDGA